MIFRELLILGKLLFQYYLNGIFRKSKKQNKEHRKNGLKNCGLINRTFITIFGAVEIMHYKFYDKTNRKVVYPFDKEHQIGESKYSHTLQDWVGKSATDNTFEESVSDFNRILGLNLAAMQSERIATKLSEKVETFYQQKDYSNN